MEYTEKEQKIIRFVSYSLTTAIELVLMGACIKSNMKTLTKVPLSVLLVGEATKNAASALKQINFKM